MNLSIKNLVYISHFYSDTINLLKEEEPLIIF